jgi:hypothetical protein
VKAPNINLEELKAQKEENFRERLKFINQYSEWVKKNPNKKWSTQQKTLINKQNPETNKD